MSSAISGSLNLSRAQSQIPIDETGAASNIQNFSTYDAVELIGYVFVDGSSADYRASVKLSIVKNGAGSYEVAASDIAGDDYLGSPIVSFSMSGSLLQATLDSALVAAESPSESYIRYALSAPAIGGQDNISIDASKIVSGTLDSGVLPEATLSSIGGVKKPLFISGYRNGNQAGLAHQTTTTILFNATTNDENGDFNTSTGEFTAPSDGVYFISASCQIVNEDDTDGIQRHILTAYVNGADVVTLFDVYHDVNPGFIRLKSTGAHMLRLSQGDKLKFAVYASLVTATDTFKVDGASSSLSYFSILKLSD